MFSRTPGLLSRPVPTSTLRLPTWRRRARTRLLASTRYSRIWSPCPPIVRPPGQPQAQGPRHRSIVLPAHTHARARTIQRPPETVCAARRRIRRGSLLRPGAHARALDVATTRTRPIPRPLVRVQGRRVHTANSRTVCVPHLAVSMVLAIVRRRRHIAMVRPPTRFARYHWRVSVRARTGLGRGERYTASVGTSESIVREPQVSRCLRDSPPSSRQLPSQIPRPF
ncbi:uncharacterized protein TRAVEDRAFT_28307 [Trametes versicolor FP-101664 SS1]|uniref:uncharacterized protein n=1 Tax=Trametes versicolor (strain FP-101664) TaxID=717944 RepID=UPI0004624641|nr:uncharacterized protein TRAVEDRAFT_28307 [Trametes versicolor FP-101664 SS1]EIW60858.1 hypothetical protein TRAVEDRAFT_28307 [Trametes versicolor FP-101664 SS1]